MTTEVARRADFSSIRYAQVWEDADVLTRGLAIEPGDRCLSIASAGDNALALLSGDPGEVVAVDLSEAQLACLALRVAAYRTLEHGELLELIGSRESDRRLSLYERCRARNLDDDARRFWDAHRSAIEAGIGSAGKFERYFALFRTRLLPLIASRRRVAELLEPRDRAGRERFHESRWNTWRWRALFRIFFSRAVMARLGRDPAFFRYVEGNVASRILERARYALVDLAPAENPYLQWILTGRHQTALPMALRPEHFETIRSRIGRLRWRRVAIEDALRAEGRFRRFNLSDIFEYMSETSTAQVLEAIARSGEPGGRLVYWNMLVPRSRPAALADRLVSRDSLAAELFREDKAFFYSRLVVEEIAA